jgi:enoyl-CoA hydratase
VATLTLNRPKVLNALNSDTNAEIGLAIDEIAADEMVKVIVITGAGDKAFAAGADISELEGLTDPKAAVTLAKLAHDVNFKIERLEKPVIAALNGFTLGGGCELALACDMRFAADTATLGLPEITLGILPGGGGTQRLPRLVGKGMAKKLILSGNMITAAEAYRIGLVDEVVTQDNLTEAVQEFAAKLAQRPPIAIAMCKQLINEGLEVDLDRGCSLEIAYFGLVCSTQDKAEGTKAFIEKRKPKFIGK